jgi:hypothetical protein
MPRRSVTETGWLVVDATVALARKGARRGSWAGVAAARALRLLADLTTRPPLVPPRYWPERWLAELADLGRDQRSSAITAARQVFRRLVLAVVTEILDQIDLTTLIQDRVDLDTLVSGIDLNAIAARVDLDAIVARLDLIEVDQAVTAWADRVFRSRPVMKGDTEMRGETDEPAEPA